METPGISFLNWEMKLNLMDLKEILEDDIFDI